MSLVVTVLSHAARHAELTSILSEREHAPPALLLQTLHVRDLWNNFKELDVVLKKRVDTTLNEKKHYERVRDSTTARLSYALIGQASKYQSRTVQEAKAYEHAVEEEYLTKMKWEKSLKEVEQAEKLEGELKVAVAEYKEARAELEEIYSVIFHGFTAEFADDDTLEEVARTNDTTHEAMQSELIAETEARKLLVEAKKVMKECLPAMERAVKVVHQVKSSDLHAEVATGKMKKKLDLAQQHATHARDLISQARCLSTKINTIGSLQITERRKIPYYHSEIKGLYNEIYDQQQALKRAKEVLETEIVAVSNRIDRMKGELPISEQSASQSREDLFRLRSTQFMAVLTDPAFFLQAPPSIDDPVQSSTAFTSVDIRPVTPPPYTQ